MARHFIGATYVKLPAAGIERLREILSARERFAKPNRLVARLLPLYLEKLQHVPGKAFVLVHLRAEFPARPFELAQESREFGEAIGLGVEDAEDRMFRYDHWKDGVLQRRLASLDDWQIVEGDPEPWEKAVVESGLTDALASNQEDVEAIQAAVTVGRPVAGARWPIYGTRALAALEHHFALPPMIWILEGKEGISPP